MSSKSQNTSEYDLARNQIYKSLIENNIVHYKDIKVTNFSA